MDKYAKQYHNIFTAEDCEEILNKRLEKSTIEDGNLSDLLAYKSENSSYWKPIFSTIESKLNQCLNNYIEQFDGLFPKDALGVSHIGFLNDHSGSFTELHYDWELVNVSGKLIVKPFVVLIYLTNVEEGGDLVFPYHDLKFSPKLGSVVFIPCSYTYPHLSTPVMSGSKHVCRVTFQLDEDCFKVDELEI